MMLSSNIDEAVRSLLSAKQRTLLALIGIIIGIGSVIAMVSIGRIAENEIISEFKEMGINVITIRKEYSNREGSMSMTGQSSDQKITLKDLQGLAESIGCLRDVSPYMSSGTPRYSGKEIKNAASMGVTESYADINRLNVAKGRFLSDMDADSFFCVIGSNVAGNIEDMGAGNPMGAKIRIGDRVFTVIGILSKISRKGGRRVSVNDTVFMHITTALRIGSNAEIEAVMARVEPPVTNSQAADAVKSYFASSTNVKSINVESPEDMVDQMEKQMRIFTLLLGAIGSISLIVGGVGVMNVMLVSVSERRKEIGVRRALGARRADIRRQFLTESLMLSFVGGVLGIILGITVSWLPAHFMKWEFIISPMAVALGFGVSTAVGVFFGFYPASQAARLDPIVALRSE